MVIETTLMFLTSLKSPMFQMSLKSLMSLTFLKFLMSLKFLTYLIQTVSVIRGTSKKGLKLWAERSPWFLSLPKMARFQ